MDNELVKQKVFEAIELAEKIINVKIKHELLMYYCDLPRLELNPFYNQLSESSALVVEYYYGNPSRIYCPLGQINIDSACSWNKYIDTNPGYQNMDRFGKYIRSEFNLILHQDAIIDRFGKYGEWYKVGDSEVKLWTQFSTDEARDLFKKYLKEYILNKSEFADYKIDSWRACNVAWKRGRGNDIRH